MTLIAPVETVAPCCSRCGQLVWQSPDAWLIDSHGQTRCPAPWWRRMILLDPHTVEPPADGADLVRSGSRMVLTGMVVFALAAVAVNVASIWY